MSWSATNSTVGTVHSQPPTRYQQRHGPWSWDHRNIGGVLGLAFRCPQPIQADTASLPRTLTVVSLGPGRGRKRRQSSGDVTSPGPSAFLIQLSALLSFGSLAVSWLLCHVRCRTLSSIWHVQTTSGSPPSRPHPVLALDAEVPEIPRARLTAAQSPPQAVGQLPVPCQAPARQAQARPRLKARPRTSSLLSWAPGLSNQYQELSRCLLCLLGRCERQE